MKAKDVSIIALATAIFTLCSWIAIPLGDTPFTLQIFALCFLSALLGVKKSIFALTAYLLLGIAGVPVFSNFTGGIARLLCPTGGFLLGFLCAAPIIGSWSQRENQSGRSLFIGMLLGLLVCYVCGCLWFWVWTPQNSLWAVLSVTVLPFVLPDLLKIIRAVWVYKRIRVLKIKTRQ